MSHASKWPLSGIGRLVAVFGVVGTFVLASGSARAGASYAEANHAYEAARYADAIAQYETLVSAGVVHEHLFYNLGNAYARAGKLGHAIYNYERALRLAPGFDDARYNLAMTRQSAAEQLADVREPPVAEPMWMRVVTFFSALQLIVGFLIANALFFACLIASRILGRGARRVWLRLGTVLAAVIFAVTTGLLLGHVAYLEYMKIGIVLPRQIEVREVADETSAERAILHAGQRVRVIGREPGWLQVRFGDHAGGWVPSEMIGQL